MEESTAWLILGWRSAQFFPKPVAAESSLEGFTSLGKSIFLLRCVITKQKRAAIFDYQLEPFFIGKRR